MFDREIYPVLTPLAVGPGQPFPYISGLSLSIALFVRHPETGDERFARVKVPEGLPRFTAVEGRDLFISLETLIEHFLPWLFPGMEIGERALFRVTRDADFEVSDEADDLLEAVELEVRRRRFGGRRPAGGLGGDLEPHARAARRRPRRRLGSDLPDRGQARHGRSDADRARSIDPSFATSPGLPSRPRG